MTHEEACDPRAAQNHEKLNAHQGVPERPPPSVGRPSDCMTRRARFSEAVTKRNRTTSSMTFQAINPRQAMWYRPITRCHADIVTSIVDDVNKDILDGAKSSFTNAPD